MRPRRARLGCASRVLDFGRGACRFNEAEARAPRMRRSNAPTRLEPHSFNEAEARAPRMRSVPRDDLLERRFNEAEARAPRMLSATDADANACSIASMRPRRARLGCGGTASFADTFRSCFNEAEARAPRMLSGDESPTAAVSSELQ